MGRCLQRSTHTSGADMERDMRLTQMRRDQRTGIDSVQRHANLSLRPLRMERYRGDERTREGSGKDIERKREKSRRQRGR